MLIKFLFLFSILCLSNLSAQTYSQIHNSRSVEQSLNEINILAVMVEFQPDDFELTYGNGTFGSIYSQDYGNEILDPLPHDQKYFEDHLQFAVHYYEKVSNAKVKINYTVLPEIYTVSKTMREYSPVDDESFKSLADFSSEVWEIVDNANNDIIYSDFNTFIIFHAGVGKDISTSDLFGEARDLPSIYLGINTLREFYGDSFNGFQVGDNYFITNSLILPETESREETGIGGTTLLELSINGLIVSSIASRIGLPDLFDAETGKSAIGRFGLMDGQSLFAFAGVFPPEPSAWEKLFLGWEDVIEIDVSTEDLMVTTSRAAQSGDYKIIKIPINSTEYFLIENRNRDVNDDGITITYKVAGEKRTIHFSEDLENFNNSFVDTLKGVILDVDEHDWALPGSGILIWHIDEKIIAQGIDQNRVNVGDSRGVDLEEADGIQDIGEEFQTIFGDIVIAEGEEFDFWYSENTSELYVNEFGINTKPNTKSNAGANSLIRLSNFSGISNKMKFDVSFGSSELSLVSKFKVDSSMNISNFKIISDQNNIGSYFQSGDNIYRIGETLESLDKFTTENFALLNSGDSEIVFGGFENLLNIGIFEDNSFRNLSSIELNSSISAPVTINRISSDEVYIYLGLENGNVNQYNFNIDSGSDPVLNMTYELFETKVDQVLLVNNDVSALSNNIFYNSGISYEFPDAIKMAASSIGFAGNYMVVLLTEDNLIYIINDGVDEYNQIFKSQSEINSFALADLKNDGNNYIVFNSNNEIHAINMSGGYAKRFPLKLRPNTSFEGFITAGDLNNDGTSDIIASTIEGVIYSFSGSDGAIINGFPLSTGGKFNGNLAVIEQETDIIISSCTVNNEIYFWSVKSSGEVEWGNILGNNSNNSVLDAAKDINYVSEFFPPNRTYNWPNPVYGNETFIRTYVSEDSNVKVRVFDITGDLVDEFEFFARGGFDTEYAWIVDEIQSGAYLAHLEVKSPSGKIESKIIKIAVIK